MRFSFLHTMLAKVTTLLFASLFILANTTSPLQANNLASNATVLNYLVEMERQAGQGCANESVKLPALTPSTNLQEIADILATSDTQLTDILTMRGMDKAAVFSAFVHADSAKDAVKKLRLANCSQLLNPHFTQIGANQHGTKWTVVMAGEPQAATQQESTDILVNPENTAPEYETVPLAQTNENTPAAQKRSTYGKYSDGETVYLPGKNEHSEPASPQVIGVYTDDTLTPIQGAQETTHFQDAPQQPVSLTPPPNAPSANKPTQVAPQAPPAQTQSTTPRQTHGKYSDGEALFLPEKNEHRDAAEPQVTGVYDDQTLTPKAQEHQTPPPAPLAPEPEYEESTHDPNDAAPPQITGVYRE